MILSCVQGKNEDLFPSVLSMYVPAGSKVADVTWGNGNFWKKVDSGVYEILASDLKTNGVDFRQLPYEDCSVNAVILDPPYMYNPKGTVKESLSSTYALNPSQVSIRNNKEVLQLYYDGIVEARRVVKVGGVIIIKCMDIIESGKQKWNHIEIKEFCEKARLVTEDLFVLMQQTQPAKRWENQKHARKNHSYFWVFRKRKG